MLDELSQLEKEQRAKKHVISFLKKSSEYRKPFEANWEKVQAEYLNTRSVKQNILQRANLKIPYAFTTVETFTPQIVEAFLGEKPYIEAKGMNDEDDPDAEAIGKHFTYQLDRTGFFSKFTVAVKGDLLFGTLIGKAIWSTKVRNGHTYFDGVEVNNVELQDFYPDWAANNPGDIQSMRGCVHRVYRSLDQIKEKEQRKINGETVGIYRNVDKLEMSLRQKGSEAWVNMSAPPDDDMSRAKDMAMGQEAGAKTNDRVELWEYWGLFGLDGIDSDPVECIITIANGDIVLRVEPNPFKEQHKPFFAAVDYPVPGEFYGIGEILPIISLIREGTALRNARLDQTNQSVNRMWLVDRNSGINVRNLYTRPGGIILANDINGIKALDAPESSPAASRDTAQIDYDIQNATAQTNASQSVSNVGRAFGRTAAGINFMQGTTNSRMALKVRLIEDMFIKELGRQMMLLNSQFMDDVTWKRLYNDTPNPYTKYQTEDFCQEYDFQAVGAMERLNKQQRQQVFASVLVPYLQALNQNQPNTIKWDNLTARMFKEFDYRNGQELVTTQEERDQMQQQALVQQQQVEMHNREMDVQAQAALQEQSKRGKIEQENVKAANKAGLEVIKGLANYGTKGR